ncbi:flavin-dependent oxidoreductase [Humitalea sp. 24SJ18S-53]|uniref:flavin-dependent oxidoreductase n=1 Tax=Humitalea sp. 24SJ18S-53 TaxID=3422307 RepID=UPI003D67AB9B
MKVLIIGGGIGGLTAALSLQAAGIAVEVAEAVAETRPLGVGINLLPHAVRELTELGLGDALATIGIETRELIYTNRFGQRIWREDRGRAAGYAWPQYSLHRGRLQMLLLDAARARLPPGAIRNGRRLVRIDPGPVAIFADGSTTAADIIVAADGIHSAARAQFHPDEGPPRWNGRILWRATSAAPPYLTGASMVMAGHQDQKFVCYPIDTLPDGRALVNWIAELRVPPHDFPREDWNRVADTNTFLPRFTDWDFGWLDVPTLIRAAKIVYEFPMVDRDPLPRWTQGRVTLLGDAAHPMYPIGSNGASQAIVDARVLAWHLATAADPDAALAAYEDARRPATAAIVLANRRNGPERVMQMAQDRAPQGFADITAVIPAAELQATAAEYKMVAGFDPAALNARLSYSPRNSATQSE